VKWSFSFYFTSILSRFFTPCRVREHPACQRRIHRDGMRLVSVWIGKFRFKIEGLGLELGDATDPQAQASRGSRAPKRIQTVTRGVNQVDTGASFPA